MKIKYAPAPLLTGHDTADRAFWLDGEVVNGGVLKPNGRYLSVEPTGHYKDEAGVNGLYEQLAPAPDLNVLIVKPRVATFRIPYVEV